MLIMILLQPMVFRMKSLIHSAEKNYFEVIVSFVIYFGTQRIVSVALSIIKILLGWYDKLKPLHCGLEQRLEIRSH